MCKRDRGRYRAYEDWRQLCCGYIRLLCKRDKYSSGHKYQSARISGAVTVNVPYVGMDSDRDVITELTDLAADMAIESIKLLPENTALDGDHPAALNARSKRQVFERFLAAHADSTGSECTDRLRAQTDAAFG